MAEHHNHVPGPNEPDPLNIRQRGFQGGATGIGPRPTMELTYGMVRYEDGEGPFANLRLPQGTGSGLSGLPQASAGAVPPLYNDPDSPEPESPR